MKRTLISLAVQYACYIIGEEYRRKQMEASHAPTASH